MIETLFLTMTVLGTVTFVGAMLWHHMFGEAVRNWRALRNAPRLPISEVKEGQIAKVVGRLRLAGSEPLVAPFTSRPCAYYEVKVDQKKSSGKSSYWEKIINTMEAQPSFFVEDDSGKALVTLDSHQVLLTMDAFFKSGILNDASDRLKAFLMRHGESSQGWVFNKTIRYKEGVLEEGELVAVLGLCSWEPDPNPPPGAGGYGGYRDMPMRLHIKAATEKQMLVSDDPTVL